MIPAGDDPSGGESTRGVMTGVGAPCFHARMGRHTASDGSPVHPLVAQGLARRWADPAGLRRAVHAEEDGGGLGWPAPPAPGGGGLGWPADLDDVRAAEPPATEPAAPEVPAGRRRGWRRLFGMSSAA